MMQASTTRAFPVATVCALALALIPGLVPAGHAQERTIRCESKHYRYRYCSVDTDNRVRLERQRSTTRCTQGVNWGYDRRGVWVDRGCDADFRVGRDGGGSGAAVAGAAIAGVAIAAAMAASRDKSHGDVASWAVGTFSGYDQLENTDVEITILPGGSVDGFVGGKRFTGTLHDKRLELGRYRFRIDRTGNGFVAADERDSNHRLNFRRSGSGYDAY